MSSFVWFVFFFTFLQAGEKMVSVTQKSRGCVLLLLFFHPSVCPPLPVLALPALSVSVWSVLSSAVFIASVGNTNISTTSNTFTISAILKSSTTNPTSSFKASFRALNPDKSMSATSTISLSHLVVTKTPSHLPCQSLKQIYLNISLLPYSKHLALSFKTVAPPLHEKLPCHLSKMTQAHKLPSDVSTSCLPLTSKTSPPPLAKAFLNPLPKSSPFPPKPAASHQLRPPPPPSLLHTRGPLFDNQPFIVSWNIPDLVCNRYNISLDTSAFKGVATPAKVREHRLMDAECLMGRGKKSKKATCMPWGTSVPKIVGHFVTFCPIERHLGEHLTMFCSVERCLRGNFTTFGQLEGHPRLERHPSSCFFCQGCIPEGTFTACFF